MIQLLSSIGYYLVIDVQDWGHYSYDYIDIQLNTRHKYVWNYYHTDYNGKCK